MTWIRFVMLYFFMTVLKAACQTLSKAFLKSMKIWHTSCWCRRYFSQRICRLKICSVVLSPALKPACSSVMISAYGFNLFIMIFSMTLLGWLMRLIVRQFWRCYRLPCLGIVMTEDLVHGVGHSPVRQIWSQIVVRVAITPSQPAWTSSAGMSTPADFPSFSDCTAASTSLRMMEWSSPVCSGDSSVLMDLR